MAKFNLTVLVKLKNIITISITDFIHDDGFISLSFHCAAIPIPTVSHLQVTATHDNALTGISGARRQPPYSRRVVAHNCWFGNRALRR